MVCTTTQLPSHLLTSNGQLGSPVLILLESYPQQDALLLVPIIVLSMVIHLFFMILSDHLYLIPQVGNYSLQLLNLSGPLYPIALNVIQLLLLPD